MRKRTTTRRSAIWLHSGAIYQLMDTFAIRMLCEMTSEFCCSLLGHEYFQSPWKRRIESFRMDCVLDTKWIQIFRLRRDVQKNVVFYKIIIDKTSLAQKFIQFSNSLACDENLLNSNSSFIATLLIQKAFVWNFIGERYGAVIDARAHMRNSCAQRPFFVYIMFLHAHSLSRASVSSNIANETIKLTKRSIYSVERKKMYIRIRSSSREICSTQVFIIIMFIRNVVAPPTLSTRIQSVQQINYFAEIRILFIIFPIPIPIHSYLVCTIMITDYAKKEENKWAINHNALLLYAEHTLKVLIQFKWCFIPASFIQIFSMIGLCGSILHV